MAFPAYLAVRQTKKRGYSMRIEAIPVGNNPPDDINVIIEVPVGGEPIK